MVYGVDGEVMEGGDSWCRIYCESGGVVVFVVAGRGRVDDCEVVGGVDEDLW